MSDAIEQTVFIVDDDEAIRDSLQWLLESHDMRVRLYTSPQEFLDACDASDSGCLVLDVRMPEMSGLELHEKLRERGMSWPVVFITGHGDVPMAVSALKSGAVDFIEKPFRDEDMLGLVRKCLLVDAERRVQKRRCVSVQERFALLTDREREVMQLIVAGLLNKQVADQLGISVKTVEVHRGRVMDKMRARTVVDLVQLSLLLEG
ncbi:MAG: response regulator [Rhodocyclaceae bacterium]|nr:response regulator [Rhodocyclaceae bacterium]